MTKYFTGAVGSLLGALAGGWLMVAPFALAYQPEGAGWADPTFVDFWTGLLLTAVSLVGFAAFALALVEALRERGIVEPRAQTSSQGSREPAPAEGEGSASGSQKDVDQLLLPLVNAMLEDMQTGRDRERTAEETEQNTRMRSGMTEYEKGMNSR